MRIPAPASRPATLVAGLLLAAPLGAQTRLLRTPSVSATQIAFAYANNVWVVDRAGGAARRLTSFQGETSNPKFSPDGKWVAYTGDESGRPQVYVVPFPGPGGKWQVSAAGGSYPRWKGDGRELFFLSPDGKMMSVVVDGTADAFRAEAPRALFTAPVAVQQGYQYAVTGDGQRFLLNTAVPTPVSVTVVSDWTLALKK